MDTKATYEITTTSTLIIAAYLGIKSQGTLLCE